MLFQTHMAKLARKLPSVIGQSSAAFPALKPYTHPLNVPHQRWLANHRLQLPDSLGHVGSKEHPNTPKLFLTTNSSLSSITGLNVWNHYVSSQFISTQNPCSSFLKTCLVHRNLSRHVLHKGDLLFALQTNQRSVPFCMLMNLWLFNVLLQDFPSIAKLNPVLQRQVRVL